MEFNLDGLHCQPPGIQWVQPHVGDSGPIHKDGPLHPTHDPVANPRPSPNLTPRDMALHTLLEEINSDRDSWFGRRFWESLMKLLNVDVRMSTAYHPQSNSATEWVSQTLEQYVRNYCAINRTTGLTCFLWHRTRIIRPPQSHARCHRSMATMASSPKDLGQLQIGNGITSTPLVRSSIRARKRHGKK